MTIGTEHEFSINNPEFILQPNSDKIIHEICGSYKNDISFGEISLGKELQKTVIEMVPRHYSNVISTLESQLVNGMDRFNRAFGDRYQLLGLGMHPHASPLNIPIWDHDENEFYEVYDRLFNIHQHGWVNIQALQINLSYSNENHLVKQYNRIRELLPYLIAVTTSSPIVEDQLTGYCDNRLIYYRNNQKEIPSICNSIIPEKITSIADYRSMQEKIFIELHSHDADILCEEWVNSSGLIIRFSRNCLEIKAIDEQESIRSDMAVSAFICALLRAPMFYMEQDQDTLLALTEESIRYGTKKHIPELRKIYRVAWEHATPDERFYLPIIQDRISNGSIAERIRDRIFRGDKINEVLVDMSNSLKTNIPYGNKET